MDMSTDSAAPVVVDLQYLGRPEAIAVAVVRTPAGALLVDCGPTTGLPVLTRALADLGIESADLHGLLLTHIHLDHAGAAGTLVRRHPHLRVYVHERGAPHLADPAKLIASATRLWGDRMDQLWGEFAPVPAGNIRVAADGEVLEFGAARIEVAYTPGHAAHHACYFDHRSGIAYAGDTGGIRLGASPFVLPPTPPPDIDVPAWQESLSRISAWEPQGVFVTHFGLFLDAERHLGVLSRELDAWTRLAQEVLDAGGDEASLTRRFVDGARARIERFVTPGEAARYRESMSIEDCWIGLARYLRKPQARAQERASTQPA